MLKIPILSTNLPKMGFFAPNFAFLDKNVWIRKFSDNFSTSIRPFSLLPDDTAREELFKNLLIFDEIVSL